MTSSVMDSKRSIQTVIARVTKISARQSTNNDGPKKHPILGLSLPEWIVLALFSSIAAVTVTFHEPWADEAQAWLIARDLSFGKMLFQVKYEGSPPLWHILLWILCRLHMPYSHIGWVSSGVMIAAIYLWLRYAPLPAWLRFLTPFTFFLQYQNSVVARSYCLTTVLAFASVAIWRSGKRSLISLGFLLALMCQTNLYGFALAGSLAAYFWLELFLHKPKAPSRRDRIELWIATITIIISACIAARLAAPPSDVSFPGITSLTQPPQSYWWTVLILRVRLAFQGTFGSSTLGMVLLLTLVAWLAESKRRLCIIPYLSMLVIAGTLYFQAWHLGMLVVGLLTSVWLAWPVRDTTSSKHALIYIFSCILFIILAIQTRWTIIAVNNDIFKPYSGAKAVADYLRPQIGHRDIYGAHYYTIGVLPYFDYNIFMNQPSHSYWAWSVNDTSDSSMLVRKFQAPSTVVVGWAFQRNRNKDRIAAVLKGQQFRLTHTFCGFLFMRDDYSELSCYDIYEN